MRTGDEELPTARIVGEKRRRWARTLSPRGGQRLVTPCRCSNSLFAEASAPPAFAALSWARNSAGATPRQPGAWLAAGVAGRHAWTPPAMCASATAGDCGDFVSAVFHERRYIWRFICRPVTKHAGRPAVGPYPPLNERTPKRFTRPVRERSERRGPEGKSGPAPGRAFFARAPVHPPETPFGLAPPAAPFPSPPSSIAAAASVRGSPLRFATLWKITVNQFSYNHQSIEHYAKTSVQHGRCGEDRVLECGGFSPRPPVGRRGRERRTQSPRRPGAERADSDGWGGRMRAAKTRTQAGAGAEADIPGGRGDATAPRPSRVNCGDIVSPVFRKWRGL